MAETKSEEKGIDMSSDSEPLDDASHVVAPGSRASSPTSSPQPEKPASDMPNKRQEKSREPTDISDEAMLHGAPFYIMITSIVLAALLVALNATILGTATPAITSEFHTVQDVGWYASAYLIGCCAMTPLMGILYRMFHLKILFLVMIVIFELGSLVAATARSSAILIVGRAISGVGSSGIITGATTMTAATVPLSKRTFIIGISMGCLAIGQTLGPLIGGLLTTYVSWRWCFYINLPLGGAVILLFGVLVKLPVTRLTQSTLTLRQKLLSIDLIGFTAFVSACVMLLLGLEWGGDTYPWDSATIIGLLCGGIAAFGCVVGWFIYKGNKALIPPRLAKNRVNLAIFLTAFVQAGGVYTSSFWLPVWFQGVKGASPISSGVMILPMIISQFVASVVCGALVQKTGYYLPEVLAGNAMVAIGAALMSTFQPDTSEGQWIGYQILIGGGRGLALQLLVTAIQTNLPAEDASLGASFVMFSQYFGGAIFAAIAKTVFTSSIGPAVEKYAPNINPSVLIDNGVTDLRSAIPAEDLAGALLAYNDSLDRVFDVQLAAACAAVVTGVFVGWRKVNKKKAPGKSDDPEAGREIESSSEPNPVSTGASEKAGENTV